MDDGLDFIIEQIGARVRAHGWMVGTAESCTGGQIAAAIAARAGVSSWFAGGVVSYARVVKVGVLDVPKSAVLTHGEVSLPVARHMARGLKQNLPCDWAVSVTGIAGPGGGTPQKPVGTVVFGLAGPSIGERVTWRQFPGDRAAVQAASVRFALEYLLAALAE